MTGHRTIITCFLFVLFARCKQTSSSSRIIEHITNKPDDFDKIVTTCFSDPTLLNNLDRTTEFANLRPETKDVIEKIDLGKIRYVSMASEYCNGKKSLKLEIENYEQEHLEFSQCTDTVHKSGQEETLPDGFIKVHYLNNHWTFWVDNDPL